MSGVTKYRSQAREGQKEGIESFTILIGQSESNSIVMVAKTLVQLALPTGLLGAKLKFLTETYPQSGAFELASDVNGDDYEIINPTALPRNVQIYALDFMSAYSLKIKTVDASGNPVVQTSDIIVHPTLHAV